MAALYFSILFIAAINSQPVSQSDCVDPLPTEWAESYCPEEITRIEYQIPIDFQKLTANGANTVDQIDLALKWIHDHFQENKYLGEFRVRTSKIKKYYRDVTQLNIIKTQIENNQVRPPKFSSLKYRRTLGSFQNTDSFGDSRLKYQNDLTFKAEMSSQGRSLDYLQVVITSDYDHDDNDTTPVINLNDIFGYKLEPNVFIDTCIKKDWLNYIYGLETTGYSGKIEFDDDETLVPDGTDGEIIVDTSNWPNANDQDAFYCGDCSSNSCICCEIETFFPEYCFYFGQYALTTKEYTFSNYIDYVLDIDFYWYKNKDWDPIQETPEVATSEGKLTFQVHYNNLDDKNDDITGKRETEFSVKLYKSDTQDNEWENLLLFAEELIDNLVFPPDDIPSNDWIDYTDCFISGTCQHDGNGRAQLDNRCPRQQTEVDCLATGNGHCQWILP